MSTPVALLRFLGRALLQGAGAGLTGEFLVEVLPDVVKDAWGHWHKGREEAERRAEIEGLIRATGAEVRNAVAALVLELAGDQTRETRDALSAYLAHVPQTIRHAMRRPEDPTGGSLPPRFSLRKPEDLLPFLPARTPRFHPGEKPLPGVDWQLEELLGVGGFGEVWKARNPNMSSAPAVALKFCLDPTSAKVLRNEAKLLDRLMLQGKHPGIVSLRQTYLSADPPCLEYEFIPGGNLAGMISEWHRDRNGPSPIYAAQIIRRLSKIVGFAHKLNPPIVHRDLKPANILAQRLQDSSISLRVADFGNGGVAASHAIRQTMRGTTQAQLLVSAVRGACTPLYASPQQLRGSDADPRDDVYALGVIWYQLLTGDLSSGRPGGTRWMRRLSENGMSAPLVELLGACIEDNPDDRPRNAAALSEQLNDLLDANERGETAPVAQVVGDDQVPLTLPKRVLNSVGMTMVLIPPVTFRMGSPPTEPERGKDEGPQHEVTLTRPYYMGIYPVTQRQYENIMGINPSYFSSAKGGGPDFPVETVSWEEANEFCRRLSARPPERLAGRTYRLPTEAEWENACRGGVPMPFAFGPTLSSREANFNGNYPYGMTPRGPFLERSSRVGSYSPNPLGLYDMHGNVWEWCSDYYDRNYYRNSPRYDPTGPTTGTLRIVRGGSCLNIGRFCRSAYRFGITPINRDLDVGFRVVMELAQEE